jgi:hypothetical protein
VVGAGSVVTRDLPDRSVAVGVPARVIRRYDDVLGWVSVDRDGAPLQRDTRADTRAAALVDHVVSSERAAALIAVTALDR